jgi:hypothetical protein
VNRFAGRRQAAKTAKVSRNGTINARHPDDGAVSIFEIDRCARSLLATLDPLAFFAAWRLPANLFTGLDSAPP